MRLVVVIREACRGGSRGGTTKPCEVAEVLVDHPAIQESIPAWKPRPGPSFGTGSPLGR